MTLHQEVSRLRELLAKATPGPLSVETDATGRVYIHGGPSTETKGLGPKSRALIAGGCSEYTLTPENAAAFVEAVNALPALLDSLEAAPGMGEPALRERRIEVETEQLALEAYINRYVLSTEDADYEPTEWERALIVDAMQGWLVDRPRLLAEHRAAATTNVDTEWYSTPPNESKAG